VNVADQDDKTSSTPKDTADPVGTEDKPATEKIGSFMERAIEVSERLLREHKEGESKKPES
jgi:hypothetical protein